MARRGKPCGAGRSGGSSRRPCQAQDHAVGADLFDHRIADPVALATRAPSMMAKRCAGPGPHMCMLIFSAGSCSRSPVLRSARRTARRSRAAGGVSARSGSPARAALRSRCQARARARGFRAALAAPRHGRARIGASATGGSAPRRRLRRGGGLAGRSRAGAGREYRWRHPRGSWSDAVVAGAGVARGGHRDRRNRSRRCGRATAATVRWHPSRRGRGRARRPPERHWRHPRPLPYPRASPAGNRQRAGGDTSHCHGASRFAARRRSAAAIRRSRSGDWPRRRSASDLRRASRISDIASLQLPSAGADHRSPAASASNVAGPTTPSVSRPASRWKRRTASCIAASNMADGRCAGRSPAAGAGRSSRSPVPARPSPGCVEVGGAAPQRRVVAGPQLFQCHAAGIDGNAAQRKTHVERIGALQQCPVFLAARLQAQQRRSSLRRQLVEPRLAAHAIHAGRQQPGRPTPRRHRHRWRATATSPATGARRHRRRPAARAGEQAVVASRSTCGRRHGRPPGLRGIAMALPARWPGPAARRRGHQVHAAAVQRSDGDRGGRHPPTVRSRASAAPALRRGAIDPARIDQARRARSRRAGCVRRSR